jgi:hypothetical protein
MLTQLDHQLFPCHHSVQSAQHAHHCAFSKTFRFLFNVFSCSCCCSFAISCSNVDDDDASNSFAFVSLFDRRSRSTTTTTTTQTTTSALVHDVLLLAVVASVPSLHLLLASMVHQHRSAAPVVVAAHRAVVRASPTTLPIAQTTPPLDAHLSMLLLNSHQLSQVASLAPMAVHGAKTRSLVVSLLPPSVLVAAAVAE